MTQPAKCHAHNKRGQPCGSLALTGQRVCHYHGGKAPQALAKAEERMRALIHPAIAALERQINKDEFPATRYVLDWAGFRPSDDESAPDSAPLHVTVIFDRNADNQEPPTLQLNGHTS